MPGVVHLIAGLGVGAGYQASSGGRFTAQHALVYAINCFVGPDLGDVLEFLLSPVTPWFASQLMHVIHDAVFFPLTLGIPLAWLYSKATRYCIVSVPTRQQERTRSSFGFGSLWVRLERLSSSSQRASLSVWQCWLLIAAGSVSHFFLEVLFEDNGKSSFFLWIISTGFWQPIDNPVDAGSAMAMIFVCVGLLGGFLYIHWPRVSEGVSPTDQGRKTIVLMLGVTGMYMLYLAVRIFWITPHEPAMGEEADFGVLVFLLFYAVFPCWLLYQSTRTEWTDRAPVQQYQPVDEEGEPQDLEVSEFVPDEKPTTNESEDSQSDVIISVPLGPLDRAAVQV